MRQVFTITFVAVMATLGISTLFSYFFIKVWQEEYAWWAQCQDKLASARRLVLSRRKQL